MKRKSKVSHRNERRATRLPERLDVQAPQAANRRSALFRVGLLVAFVVLCACDVSRGPEPVRECEQYANRLQTCFGDRMASRMDLRAYSSNDDVKRDRLKAQCSAGLEKLTKVCK